MAKLIEEIDQLTQYLTAEKNRKSNGFYEKFDDVSKFIKVSWYVSKYIDLARLSKNHHQKNREFLLNKFSGMSAELAQNLTSFLRFSLRELSNSEVEKYSNKLEEHMGKEVLRKVKSQEQVANVEVDYSMFVIASQRKKCAIIDPAKEKGSMIKSARKKKRDKALDLELEAKHFPLKELMKKEYQSTQHTEEKEKNANKEGEEESNSLFSKFDRAEGIKYEFSDPSQIRVTEESISWSQPPKNVLPSIQQSRRGSQKEMSFNIFQRKQSKQNSQGECNLVSEQPK